MPRRICSTVRNPPQTMMFDSPRPVEPAAPISLSVYCPAPTMGLSPTLPGSFQARPLVVVTDDTSPLAFTTSRLIVPVGRATMGVLGGTSSQSSSGLRLARHSSQSCRDSGVSRSSSLKPYDNAKRFAPSPTSKMWLVYSNTSLATSLGVLIPSRAATAPARLVGPCMHEASSCTTPSSLGSPP